MGKAEAYMAKRFVPVQDVDRRAIALYKMLREVEQMPLVKVIVFDDEPKPIICLKDVNDPEQWFNFSVTGFLRLSAVENFMLGDDDE
ncbi:hypothetical protein B2M20_05605 [Nitrobacter vulgaris]|uniref:Uncharacterized protein n=2 Tax=Nitrobacter vulgaris TaxID=29421 RepID=A0A1V4I1E6_NITVU|nr:hypothetical protein B2M20_05605 [Nitrobacter vulgaris]